MTATATMDAREWKLGVTDCDRDDEGCARFQVNSMIPADDSDAIGRAAKVMEAAPALVAAMERAAKWMDFVTKKLRDSPDELAREMRKHGAAKAVWQFGDGASHRAKELRAAIAQAEGRAES